MHTRTMLRLVLSGLVISLILAAIPGLATITAHDLSPPAIKILLTAAFVLGLASTGAGLMYCRQHFTGLRNLRERVVISLTDETHSLPALASEDTPREIMELHAVINHLLEHRLQWISRPSARLTAILRSISEAIVVVTATGQVSLVNSAAKTLLGAERIAVGTSVYAALSRHLVEAAIARALTEGRTIEAKLLTVENHSLYVRVSSLGAIGGAVFSFVVDQQEHPNYLVEHDMTLHDAAPIPRIYDESSLLADLPVFVFDCETTGLNVHQDAIVSVGGVRMHGERIFRSATIDRLVNPQRSIPERSTRIHGITDAMIKEAATFPVVWHSLAPMIDSCVLVGHNIAFDVAQLRNATQRAGIDWTPPPTLDTLLLASVLEPDETEFTLEKIAARLGVNARGRHTALGDSLVTAEIYARMLLWLNEIGITTFGEALAFSRRATAIIEHQRASGWFHKI